MIRYAAFRSRGYAFFTLGNLLSIIGRQMLAVVVSGTGLSAHPFCDGPWARGLVIAIPVVGLSLPAGHLADRFSRKQIIIVSQILSSLISVGTGVSLLETSCHSQCIDSARRESGIERHRGDLRTA